MKTKRLVSCLLLLTMLVVLVFSGCGKIEQGDSNGTTSGTTETQQTSDTQKDDSWALLEPISKEAGELTTPRGNYITYPVADDGVSEKSYPSGFKGVQRSPS